MRLALVGSMALSLALFALSLVGCSDGGRRGGGGGNGQGGAVDLGGGSDGGLPTYADDMGPCEEVVDVVFVLDVSSSMGFVLDKLEAEIAAVVDAANALQPDAHFGLVTFADNDRLDTTGPLEMGRVHTAAATLQAAFHAAKTTYTNANRNPGDGPTGPTQQNPICEENALDALADAASQFPWRPNATRVVIAVTDDTFLERPDNYGDRDHDGRTDKTDFPREGDYPARFTVPEAVQALRDQRARVFSFTRLKAPGALDLNKCGTGRRKPWSAITDGWSTPYNGNTPIPTATGKNFDLELVRAGTLSLSATINDVVVQSYCNPPVY
jgi:hypothetical protein